MNYDVKKAEKYKDFCFHNYYFMGNLTVPLDWIQIYMHKRHTGRHIKVTTLISLQQKRVNVEVYSCNEKLILLKAALIQPMRNMNDSV